MLRLRKFWKSLQCQLGRHNWSDWQPCVVGTLTTFNTLNKFRECARCPKKECERTLYGLLLDDVQFEEEFNIRGQVVQAMAREVLNEFTRTMTGGMFR